MRLRLAVCSAAVCFCCGAILWAQDATKVDAKHYKVESENEQMRILKVHYGAHEKSVMHSHPAGAAVFLTDAKVRFTFPDGKTQDVEVKAGDTQLVSAVTHLPENIGDKDMDLVLVELKGKTAKTAKAAKPAKTETK